jgi:hypothetical protein
LPTAYHLLLTTIYIRATKRGFLWFSEKMSFYKTKFFRVIINSNKYLEGDGQKSYEPERYFNCSLTKEEGYKKTLLKGGGNLGLVIRLSLGVSFILGSCGNKKQ